MDRVDLASHANGHTHTLKLVDGFTFFIYLNNSFFL